MDKKLRILLIQPPYRTSVLLFNQLYPLPYGLMCIAAYVRERGFTDLTIKDFLEEQNQEYLPVPEALKGKARCYFHYGTREKDIECWIKDNINKFDVVAVNTLQTPLFEGTKLVAKYIRKYSKDVTIVGGGPCSTTTPELIINDFDYLIRGEGEIAFYELLKEIESGKLPKRGIYNKEFMFVRDLDDLPFPAWDLINLEKYPKYAGRVRASLGSSRGCSYGCRFCSVCTLWGRQWRMQSVPKVMETLDKLYELGARYIVFYDDNLLLDVNRGKELLREIIKRNYKGVKFLVEEGMQVKHAQDEELVKLLIESKFDDIKIGLETANANILKDISKPTNLIEFERAVKVFNKLNYYPKTFYIIGFDGETVESIFKNILYMSSFNIKFRINTLNLLPNTDMHKEYLKKGYVTNEYDWRLSTFYTIPTKGFTWEDIKRLKSILKGINWSNGLGIDTFKDDLKKLITKLKNKKYNLIIEKDKLILTGHMFNYSEKASFLKMVGLRMAFTNFRVKKEGNALILVNSKIPDRFLDKLRKVLIEENRMLKKYNKKIGLENWGLK